MISAVHTLAHDATTSGMSERKGKRYPLALSTQRHRGFIFELWCHLTTCWFNTVGPEQKLEDNAVFARVSAVRGFR